MDFLSIGFICVHLDIESVLDASIVGKVKLLASLCVIRDCQCGIKTSLV